jgi:hypothetical protein
MRVQVHFGEDGFPVSVSTQLSGRKRVVVEVDGFEPGISRTVLLLHHANVPQIIIAATTRLETAQRALARRGAGAKVYRLIRVPVVDPDKGRPPVRNPGRGGGSRHKNPQISMT